ncbi:hypothetical protein QN277_005768 [Acacia crassicarpa]|uniref:Coatomer subunit zeta n=1 Tax=Acacia crassicarpa TaxID=499986 RepID=A0AAE1IZV3_9FABA|nr:hypothetical protein QN277_005768 [Acacia crassicarpa]
MDLSLIFCNTLNSQALPNCGFSNMHPILPSTHSQISKPCYATSSLEVLKSMLVMQIFGSSPILWESRPSVKNILLLDSEGKRVAVKYYSDDWPTNSAKEAFEKAIQQDSKDQCLNRSGNNNL